jgi:hypothetical protein
MNVSPHRSHAGKNRPACAPFTRILC